MIKMTSQQTKYNVKVTEFCAMSYKCNKVNSDSKKSKCKISSKPLRLLFTSNHVKTYIQLSGPQLYGFAIIRIANHDQITFQGHNLN